jgi:fermentation-respiration switch protein FrsA (DUF1100 family)
MEYKEELNLCQEWDKTFPKNENVDHEKITFYNNFGYTLAADVYKPKNASKKLPAIAVSGPYGAVKEQVSGLYAQELAARGYYTIAFDPSSTGESSGKIRNVASPDLNTEDFMAAVDFLSTNEEVDPERIGILGVCGWGGLALNAAALDPRIKATVASTMYDLSRNAQNGYFDEAGKEERAAARIASAKQRTIDYQSKTYARTGGVVDPLPEDAPFFVKDYYDYYKTKRGYHPRSLNSNQGWNVTGIMSFMNTPQLYFADEIENAVMIVHGDKAHSCYFGKDAYKKLKGDNKKLLLIEGAVHTDLYDQVDIIPFDEIEAFYNTYLV